MELTAQHIEQIPPGNLRVPRAEFAAVWAAAEHLCDVNDERKVSDWYTVGLSADLEVCVVDGVVDAAMARLGSAWADEFRALSSGRVAAWGRGRDAGGACGTERFGQCLAQLAIVFLEVADPFGGRLEAAEQGFVGGALSPRGQSWGRWLVSCA
jgi:hypothetical protein